jgi:formylglycine-generating enzyme required for sulfatase activity
MPGIVVVGPGRGHRVLRGGAFNNETDNMRGAARNRNNPNNRNNNIGFRVVRPTIFYGFVVGNTSRSRL